MNPDVMVVLLNYKRPQNMRQIIPAWKNQTVTPKRVVVVDNGPGFEAGSEQYPMPNLRSADDVWRFRENLGPPCRWAPALIYHDCPYVVFADDDLIPGPEALAFMLETAVALGDQFATLGVIGRDFQLDRPAGHRYNGRFQPARLAAKARPVHMTCRVHLVRSRWLPFALHFRQRLLDVFGDEAVPLVDFHEDIQLCLGIQMEPSCPSYLLPSEVRPEQKVILKDLDDFQASWRRPGHFAQRNRLVDMALEVGWKPCGVRS